MKNKKMKAIVYSPYLDTLGGGEKYTVAVIKAFLLKGYSVDILWPDSQIISQINNRYGIDISQAKILPQAEKIISSNLFTRFKFLKSYHHCFFVSDGSLPFLFTQNNIIHFQVPFHHLHSPKISNYFKKKLINHYLCNSKFTKQIIDQEYTITSQVLYPPAQMIKPQNKQPIILSVGRFDNLLHSKRQDILIESFNKLNNPAWKLILAGGVLHQSGTQYLNQLIGQAKSNPSIHIHPNPSWSELESYFSKASLYWHAAGYGHDSHTHPEKMEHFGIAIVEAMSAGAIPLVYAQGGPREIICDHENGFLWHKPYQLIKQSLDLINSPRLITAISNRAQQSAQKYNLEAFYHGFNQFIS